jgi:catechol 2,3-dioxygenase-like lactoylglutathione lyase family enzyme
MGTKPVRSIDETSDTSVARIDMKVEVVVIPVSDVDRAKEFYRRLGWRLDQTPPGVVQFTPHGSGCSVQFGTKLTSAAPGSGKAHGQHEKRIGEADPNWPEWYAKYMVAEQAGTELPT